ncbi:MAG: N-acetylmuramoyl-L-alanine amidase [Solobacterium sp.]|jgi:hypothetical protein|nr:N-acetylmuramoyl-L-alanine amidase [Solobacterium sp.]MCH4266734.1 N-acetylmuramoyl-L-alanine amidase [Solobacterium sp.]
MSKKGKGSRNKHEDYQTEEQKNLSRSINQKKAWIAILAVAVVISAVLIGKHFLTPKTPEDERITIELDAAFGGDQPGYEGIITEAEFNEKTVDALETLLKKDSHFTVLRTHEAGTAMSVDERAAKINEDQPDVVLCIRSEDDKSADVSGMKVYANIPTSEYHDQSLQLADAIKSAFTSDAWTPTAGYLYYKPVRTAYQLHYVDESDTTDYGEETLRLMQHCNVPVVVSTGIYVTSQSDVDTWANDDGYTLAAKQYYAALKEVYVTD